MKLKVSKNTTINLVGIIGFGLLVAGAALFSLRCALLIAGILMLSASVYGATRPDEVNK